MFLRNSIRSRGVIIAIVLLVGMSSYGQKPLGPKFDVEDFNRKLETVQWLVAYDEIAWRTSDVAMAEDQSEIDKLGKEWFCFQDTKKLWHAVYGKLTDDKYEIVFHYTVDSAGKIIRTTEKIDTSFLNAHARALNLSRAKLTTSIPKNSPLFNQYIRKENDGSLSVWMLPAFQRDGTAVYGGEAYYLLDASGGKILKEESYYQPAFRGFKSSPPREIWIDYSELEKPTLGSIFFVWYYRQYFTKIFINNAHSTSTVIKAGDSYTWVHIEKDEKKNKPPELKS